MQKEKKIKQIIEEFFQKFGLEDLPENIKIEENLVSFAVQTENPQILIGRGGQVLSSVQYLLARVLSKELDERIFVDFDINDYKKKKNDYLREMAESIADEVAFTKKEKILQAMNPYERRIIHLTLSPRVDVATESCGEDPDRRIVIKPATV